MKTQFTVLMFILFTTGIFAQSFQLEWYNSYPDISAVTYGETIILDQNDSILMAGRANSWDGSMFYLKADKDGNVIRVTYADDQFTNDQDAFELMEDSDNNYVMVGGYGYYLATYFTKISQIGEVLNTTIDGGQIGYRAAYDVEQTIDGGYLMVANGSFGSGFVVGIRKTDSLGQYEWSTSYYMGKFQAMAKINNTEFIVTGYRDYDPGGAEVLDMITAKINIIGDTIGDTLWTKTYEEPNGNEMGNDIQVLPNDEGFIICGVAPNYNFPQYTNGVIQKIDLNGDIIWKQTYSRVAQTNTEFIKVLQDSNGDFLVLARTAYGSGDISLLKYSQSGTLLQESHFDNGSNEIAFDMALDSEGAIYISANIGDASILKINDVCPVDIPEVSLVDPSPQVGDDIIVAVENTNTEWEYSLIQLNGEIVLATAMGNDSTYYFNAGALTEEDVLEGLMVSVTDPAIPCTEYSETIFVDFINGINLEKGKSLSVSPNPFQDFIVIQGSENTISKLSVFDLNGRLLVEKNPFLKNPKINLSKLSSGIYFLSLDYKSGEKIFRKIVKE